MGKHICQHRKTLSVGVWSRKNQWRPRKHRIDADAVTHLLRALSFDILECTPYCTLYDVKR